MLYIYGCIALAVFVVLQIVLRASVNAFVTRLLSGIILILALLLTVGYGGRVLLGASIAVSLLGMIELLRVFDIKQNGKTDLIEAVGYAGCILYYIILYFSPANVSWIGIVLVLLLLLIVYVFSFPTYSATEVMQVFFAVVYVGVLFSCVFTTRMLENGSSVVWLIFLAAWGSDTCAYCAGMLWGKHAMTPTLSPKKTWEGALGGLAGAVILSLIYALIRGGSVPGYMLITGIAAVSSMIGDLTASAIKRDHDIKDFGHLIPGHGGILDRFDSVLFAAPIVYLFAGLLL